MSDAKECTTLRECVCVMFKRMKSVDWRRRVVVKFWSRRQKKGLSGFLGGALQNIPLERKLALANSTPALLARTNGGFLILFVYMAFL